ncbi:MAG: hypothetical protein ABGY41_14475 [Candidatus Poribacteria bacterium]
MELLIAREADANIKDSRGVRAVDFCWQPTQPAIRERLIAVTTEK